MWVKARSAVTRWLVPDEPAPPLSPAEAMQAQRDREANRAQAQAARERAERLADRAAQEQHAAALHAERARRGREAVEQQCRALGHWFPGDSAGPVTRDGFGAPRFRSWRQWVHDLVDGMGGGR